MYGMARPALKIETPNAPSTPEAKSSTPKTLKERIAEMPQNPIVQAYDNGIQPSPELSRAAAERKRVEIEAKVTESWQERQNQPPNVVDINMYRSAKAPKIKPLSQESSKNSIKGWLRGLFNA